MAGEFLERFLELFQSLLIGTGFRHIHKNLRNLLIGTGFRHTHKNLMNLFMTIIINFRLFSKKFLLGDLMRHLKEKPQVFIFSYGK